MKIRVLAADGRYIPGYGSRALGQVFDLPDELAQRYLDQHPGNYAAVERKSDTVADIEAPKKRGGKK